MSVCILHIGDHPTGKTAQPHLMQGDARARHQPFASERRRAMSSLPLGLAIRTSGFWRIHTIQPHPCLHNMARPDMRPHGDRVPVNHLDHICSHRPGDAICTLKV